MIVDNLYNSKIDTIEKIKEITKKDFNYYIDKIIREWAKKGIKTADDVEKSRINFKNKKDIKPVNDILSYDWLNDE